MQEIHSIGGGRFIGGGGERRLRPHHHHHHHHHNNNPNHQALKCPRCDSLNTKFCYYNNYNLSQPRHFCKSCRRYWTNGGVLRNVPVGGGCRKSKRSKPKNSTSSETAAAPPSPPKAPAQSQPEHERKSNSHSSSESFSTLTATATATATEAVSAPSSNSASDNLLDNIHESKFFIHPSSTSNPSFEPGTLEQGGDSGIFSEIGNLTSLMTSTNEALAFGYGNISDTLSFQFSSAPQGNDPQSQMNMGDDHQELKFPTSLIDQTVGVDLSVEQNKIGHGGYGSLDWQGSTDQGLFDLPNTVDQTYWSHSQWTDQDNPSLFHHLP